MTARALALTVGLTLFASCGDDGSSQPCSTSSGCPSGETCVEGRCRRTSVRDLGVARDATPSDDAGPAEGDGGTEDARASDAAGDRDARVDASGPVDVDAALDASPMDASPDVGPGRDATASLDAFLDVGDGSTPGDAASSDSGAPDGATDDAAPLPCRTRVDCAPGEHCAVERCGAVGVCAAAPDCVPGGAPLVCACDGTETHTFPGFCSARAAGFGGLLHDGPCVGTERATCTIGGGPARECNEHEWCEPQAGSTTPCAGSGRCEPRPDCTSTPAASGPVCGCDRWSYANDCEARAAGVSWPAAGLCSCATDDECGAGFCNLGLDPSCADGAAGLCERVPTSCAGERAQATCACPGGREFPSDCARRTDRVADAVVCACAASGEMDGCCAADADCTG
ncbi:MAG: hypothetical protein IT379_23400, partial [Deltaproteobacteria bacterium]|nr:hypothetical protein [Deltaproteobacteria bacterium]